MNLDAWAAIATRHRKAVGFVALLTTFAGLALIIDRPKEDAVEWLALPLFAAGGALFAWTAWPHSEIGAVPSDSIARRLLNRITLGGRLVPVFPGIGVGIVLLDIGYNWFLSATPAIQTEDTIVLLAAATLMSYQFVPARLARERDFVLLFFLCLTTILVAPLLIARAYYADFNRSVDVYSWVALAPETSAILQLIGVSNTVHPVVGSTAPGLTFTPQHIPIEVTLVITTACSGIYSFGIFASAFVAFVLTEFKRVSRWMWLLLGLGLLTAYVANVLRMVVIILVGFYTDSAQTDLQNMLIAHSYAGWLIFLGWIALFWGLILKFLSNERPADAMERWQTPQLSAMTRCGLCAGPLTPLLAATRCGCGAIYHRQCLSATSQCPICGRPSGIEPKPAHGAT